MQQSELDSVWWREFHVAEMADLFLERKDASELRATLEFLIRELHLESGNRIYDQCCGIGSLSIPLAERGFECIGVDLCEIYITRALQTLGTRDLACRFVCDDAFTFVPDTPSDGVINWFSSFGYADSEARNSQMAQRAFDALKPGGGYILDVPNFPNIMRGFQQFMVTTGVSNNRPVTCVRESELDLHRGLLRQKWRWLVEGKPAIERMSALRLMMPHQLVEMLQTIGFDEIVLLGGIDRSPLRIDSPRLIAIARRPA